MYVTLQQQQSHYHHYAGQALADITGQKFCYPHALADGQDQIKVGATDAAALGPS